MMSFSSVYHVGNQLKVPRKPYFSDIVMGMLIFGYFILFSLCSNPQYGQDEENVLNQGKSVLYDSEFRLDVICISDNMMKIRLSDSDEFMNHQFMPPVTIEVTINEKKVMLLDPQSEDTVTTALHDEHPIIWQIDELSLPSGQTGIYPMKITARDPANHVQLAESHLDVWVGCQDSEHDNLMSCLTNCSKWVVRW